MLNLATTGAASVVATVRVGEPCPDAVVALWHGDHADRLDFQAVSAAVLTAMVEAHLGGRLELAARRWVTEASRGSPMLARELVTGAVQTGRLADADGLWRLTGSPALSPRLLDLLGEQLSGLSPGQRRVAELLALGEPLGLPMLERLARSRPVSELERRPIIAIEQGGRRIEVRFAHPLYAEVIASEMPTGAARALRRDLATALQATGMRRTGDCLRWAAQQVDADGIIDAAVMTTAAGEAARLFDYPLSERLARAALTAGAGLHAALDLAYAASCQDRMSEADAVLAPFTSGIGSEPDAVAYLLRRIPILHAGLGDTAAAHERLDGADRWFPASTSWPPQVDGFRVLLLCDECRFAEAARVGLPLLDRPDIDQRTRFVATLAVTISLLLTGRTRQAQTISDSVIDSALDLPVEHRDAAWSSIQAWIAVRLRTGRDWDEMDRVLDGLYRAVVDRTTMC